jgi:hypothetical protein
MSICVACATCGEFTTNRSMGDTYGDVIQFRETASSSAYCAKGDTLIENQAIFILELQLDLFMNIRRPSCYIPCEQLTSFGKSTMPSFSNMPSVTMNLLVGDPWRFRSFSTLSGASSRLEVIMLEPANSMREI